MNNINKCRIDTSLIWFGNFDLASILLDTRLIARVRDVAWLVSAAHWSAHRNMGKTFVIFSVPTALHAVVGKVLGADGSAYLGSHADDGMPSRCTISPRTVYCRPGVWGLVGGGGGVHCSESHWLSPQLSCLSQNGYGKSFFLMKQLYVLLFIYINTIYNYTFW